MTHLIVPDTIWLTVANIFLGVSTFACFLAIAGAVVGEVTLRLRARRQLRKGGGAAHSLLVTELGIRMADGGEPVNERIPLFISREGHINRPDSEDLEEPNITRSSN